MKLTVNGAEVDVDDRHAKTPLLWVLRDVLGLHGTKYGCGIGYCSACAVLINGSNTRSCQTTLERVIGKAVSAHHGCNQRCRRDACIRCSSTALTTRPEPEIAPLSPEELADPVKPYIQIKPDGTVLVFSAALTA